MYFSQTDTKASDLRNFVSPNLSYRLCKFLSTVKLLLTIKPYICLFSLEFNSEEVEVSIRIANQNNTSCTSTIGDPEESRGVGNQPLRAGCPTHQ